MSEVLLSRDQLLAAIESLVEKLNGKRIPANIYIVGGAALTLEYGARDATRDIDASFGSKEQLVPFIVEVAREQGLPDDWLNNNVLGYISPVHEDPAPVVLIKDGNVKVTVASAETLLAMKIRASRGRRDRDDIAFLLQAVGVETVDAAIALYDTYYPEDPLTPRAKPVLEDAFKTISQRTSENRGDDLVTNASDSTLSPARSVNSCVEAQLPTVRTSSTN